MRRFLPIFLTTLTLLALRSFSVVRANHACGNTCDEFTEQGACTHGCGQSAHGGGISVESVPAQEGTDGGSYSTALDTAAKYTSQQDYNIDKQTHNGSSTVKELKENLAVQIETAQTEIAAAVTRATECTFCGNEGQGACDLGPPNYCSFGCKTGLSFCVTTGSCISRGDACEKVDLGPQSSNPLAYAQAVYADQVKKFNLVSTANNSAITTECKLETARLGCDCSTGESARKCLTSVLTDDNKAKAETNYTAVTNAPPPQTISAAENKLINEYVNCPRCEPEDAATIIENLSPQLQSLAKILRFAQGNPTLALKDEEKKAALIIQNAQKKIATSPVSINNPDQTYIQAGQISAQTAKTLKDLLGDTDATKALISAVSGQFQNQAESINYTRAAQKLPTTEDPARVTQLAGEYGLSADATKQLLDAGRQYAADVQKAKLAAEVQVQKQVQSDAAFNKIFQLSADKKEKEYYDQKAEILKGLDTDQIKIIEDKLASIQKINDALKKTTSYDTLDQHDRDVARNLTVEEKKIYTEALAKERLIQEYANAKSDADRKRLLTQLSPVEQAQAQALKSLNDQKVSQILISQPKTEIIPGGSVTSVCTSPAQVNIVTSKVVGLQGVNTTETKTCLWGCSAGACTSGTPEQIAAAVAAANDAKVDLKEYLGQANATDKQLFENPTVPDAVRQTLIQQRFQTTIPHGRGTIISQDQKQKYLDEATKYVDTTLNSGHLNPVGSNSPQAFNELLDKIRTLPADDARKIVDQQKDLFGKIVAEQLFVTLNPNYPARIKISDADAIAAYPLVSFLITGNPNLTTLQNIATSGMTFGDPRNPNFQAQYIPIAKTQCGIPAGVTDYSEEQKACLEARFTGLKFKFANIESQNKATAVINVGATVLGFFSGGTSYALKQAGANIALQFAPRLVQNVVVAAAFADNLTSSDRAGAAAMQTLANSGTGTPTQQQVWQEQANLAQQEVHAAYQTNLITGVALSVIMEGSGQAFGKFISPYNNNRFTEFFLGKNVLPDVLDSIPGIVRDQIWSPEDVIKPTDKVKIGFFTRDGQRFRNNDSIAGRDFINTFRSIFGYSEGTIVETNGRMFKVTADGKLLEYVFRSPSAATPAFPLLSDPTAHNATAAIIARDFDPVSKPSSPLPEDSIQILQPDGNILGIYVENLRNHPPKNVVGLLTDTSGGSPVNKLIWFDESGLPIELTSKTGAAPTIETLRQVADYIIPPEKLQAEIAQRLAQLPKSSTTPGLPEPKPGTSIMIAPQGDVAIVNGQRFVKTPTTWLPDNAISRAAIAIAQKFTPPNAATSVATTFQLVNGQSFEHANTRVDIDQAAVILVVNPADQVMVNNSPIIAGQVTLDPGDIVSITNGQIISNYEYSRRNGDMAEFNHNPEQAQPAPAAPAPIAPAPAPVASNLTVIQQANQFTDSLLSRLPINWQQYIYSSFNNPSRIFSQQPSAPPATLEFLGRSQDFGNISNDAQVSRKHLAVYRDATGKVVAIQDVSLFKNTHYLDSVGNYSPSTNRAFMVYPGDQINIPLSDKSNFIISVDQNGQLIDPSNRILSSNNKQPVINPKQTTANSNQKLFKFGEENNIIAHGVDEDKGGFKNLLPISIEGIKSPTPGENSFAGQLSNGDPAFFSGPHGPYYVVLKPDFIYTNDGTIPPSEHTAYLFPDEASKSEFLGMINNSETAAKVFTYDEYLRKNSPSLISKVINIPKNIAGLIRSLDQSLLDSRMTVLTDNNGKLRILTSSSNRITLDGHGLNTQLNGYGAFISFGDLNDMRVLNTSNQPIIVDGNSILENTAAQVGIGSTIKIGTTTYTITGYDNSIAVTRLVIDSNLPAPATPPIRSLTNKLTDTYLSFARGPLANKSAATVTTNLNNIASEAQQLTETYKPDSCSKCSVEFSKVLGLLQNAKTAQTAEEQINLFGEAYTLMLDHLLDNQPAYASARILTESELFALFGVNKDELTNSLEEGLLAVQQAKTETPLDDSPFSSSTRLTRLETEIGELMARLNPTLTDIFENKTPESADFKKFIYYITGIWLEPGNEYKLVQRMQEDSLVVRQKYNLPPRQLKVDQPAEYINQLKAIAQKEGVPIRSGAEFQRFFENHSAAAVYFGDTKTIVVPLRDINEYKEVFKFATNLEHELTHALQDKYYPGMPIEAMEYEAYAINRSPTFLENKPLDAIDISFSFYIRGSVNHWYKDQEIISKPWDDIKPPQSPSPSLPILLANFAGAINPGFVPFIQSLSENWPAINTQIDILRGFNPQNLWNFVTQPLRNWPWPGQKNKPNLEEIPTLIPNKTSIPGLPAGLEIKSPSWGNPESAREMIFLSQRDDWLVSIQEIDNGLRLFVKPNTTQSPAVKDIGDGRYINQNLATIENDEIKLIPNSGYSTKPPDDKAIYRGIYYDELIDIILSGEIQPKGNISSDLAYFADGTQDPQSASEFALGYANHGQWSRLPSFEKPNFLLVVKKPDRIPSLTGGVEVAYSGSIKVNDIIAIYEVKPYLIKEGYYPLERGDGWISPSFNSNYFYLKAPKVSTAYKRLTFEEAVSKFSQPLSPTTFLQSLKIGDTVWIGQNSFEITENNLAENGPIIQAINKLVNGQTIVVQKPNGEVVSENQIENGMITRASASSQETGGGGIESENLQPTVSAITPKKAIAAGKIELSDGRSIPIKMASSRTDIGNLLPLQPSNTVRAFHGTSFKKALNIAKHGFFGWNGTPSKPHPTLTTESFYFKTVFDQARSENGWGAIVVLDTLPNEFIPLGNVNEGLGGPKQLYTGNKDSLVDILPPELLNNSELSQIPPERITTIILVPPATP